MGKSETELITGTMVVGADGVRSKVAERLGAKSPIWKVSRHRTATIYGYVPCTGHAYHWLFEAPRGGEPGRTGGIIPTEDGLSCVFLGSTPEEFVRLHRRQPVASLKRALEAMGHERMPRIFWHDPARLHYFPGIHGHMRRCTGEGWALVGDAGYFKDPATAHGMSDALRDAELLARALLRGTESALHAYEAERDELSLRFFDLSDQVASLALSHEELRAVHRELSREMKRELARLEALAPLPITRQAA